MRSSTADIIMDKWVGRVALVTGTSSGIGAAIANELLKHGMKVIGCGRDLKRLQETQVSLSAPSNFYPIRCDVSNTEDIKQMFNWAKENHHGVDVLVNNVGLAHPEPILSGDPEKWRHMTDVNIIGTLTCIQEAYKSMIARGVDDGYIVNINSLAGHVVSQNPDFVVYSATKFAVSAITKATRYELRKENNNIRITSISPGLTETNFVNSMYNNPNRDAGDASPIKIKILDPQDIANTLIFCLSSPSHMQVDEMIVRPTKETLY